MNSTTITIGLVVVALAVGAWILLRGGKDEEGEEAVSSPPAAPRPPAAAAADHQPGPPARTLPATGRPGTGRPPGKGGGGGGTDAEQGRGGVRGYGDFLNHRVGRWPEGPGGGGSPHRGRPAAVGPVASCGIPPGRRKPP